MRSGAVASGSSGRRIQLSNRRDQDGLLSQGGLPNRNKSRSFCPDFVTIRETIAFVLTRSVCRATIGKGAIPAVKQSAAGRPIAMKCRATLLSLFLMLTLVPAIQALAEDAP